MSVQRSRRESSHGRSQSVKNHDGSVHRTVMMDVEKTEESEQQNSRDGHWRRSKGWRKGRKRKGRRMRKGRN